MSRKPKQKIEDDDPGAPEWMVTFSDCMTLLLTFFVLLLSFSSFDNKVHTMFNDTVFGDLSDIFETKRRARQSMTERQQISPTEDIESGSEKPTNDEPQSEDNRMFSKEPKTYHQKSVFVRESDKMFAGKTDTLSAKGRGVLEVLGKFLSKVPGRIVVSENGLSADFNPDTGIKRAMVVVNYLSRESLIDKSRFSISMDTTLEKSHDQLGQEERRLEVVILERSIYN